MENRILLIGVSQPVGRAITESMGSNFEIKVTDFDADGRALAKGDVLAIVLGARQFDGKTDSQEFAEQLIVRGVRLVVVSRFNYDQATFQGGVFARPEHAVSALKRVLNLQQKPGG